MPNRIIREGILSSERVDGLSSWASEVFYRRLLNVVDDFGRYYANSSLLRAACYPLKLDKVSNADIDKWLADCAGAGLVSTYDSGGKRYLQLLDFRQQERAKTSKFPQMPSECVADAVRQQRACDAPAHLVGGVVGGEDEKSNVGHTPPDDDPPNGRKPETLEAAKRILDFLNEKTGRAYKPVKVNLELIRGRLSEGATETELRQVIAKKCREWGGDEKMAIYLRPATLFGREKFAQYQGELVIPKDAIQ